MFTGEIIIILIYIFLLFFIVHGIYNIFYVRLFNCVISAVILLSLLLIKRKIYASQFVSMCVCGTHRQTKSNNYLHNDL